MTIDRNMEEVPDFGLEAPPDFSDAPNKSEREDILKKASPPSGYYETDPDTFGPMTVNTPGQDFKEPRRMVILNGRIKGTFKGKERTEFLKGFKAFKLSPDRRSQKEFVDGKPTGNVLDEDDKPTILWSRAEKAFVATYGEEPVSKQAVIDFLVNGHYRLKVWSRTGDLFVQDIEAVRNGR